MDSKRNNINDRILEQNIKFDFKKFTFVIKNWIPIYLLV